MRFVTVALFASAAACKAVVDNARDPLAVQDILVQRYNAFDNSNTDSIIELELPKELHFQQPVQVQAQVQNQTSAPAGGTDSSTPGTKTMSTWRQVVGGIAVAVLVAVV